MFSPTASLHAGTPAVQSAVAGVAAAEVAVLLNRRLLLQYKPPWFAFNVTLSFVDVLP